jgi:hypothetical protein
MRSRSIPGTKRIHHDGNYARNVEFHVCSKNSINKSKRFNMFNVISASDACKLTTKNCSEGIQSHLNSIESEIKNATKNGLSEIIYNFGYPHSDSIRSEFIQRTVQVILEESGYYLIATNPSTKEFKPTIKICWNERKYIIRCLRGYT